MRTFVDRLPQLIFSDGGDPSSAKRISRLAKAGQIRRIHRGIFTSDLSTPLDQIIRPNWRLVTEYLYPNAVLAYRSAQLGMPDENGNIFIVEGKRSRAIQFPGLKINILPGPSPVTNLGATLNDTPYGQLFIASEPRRLLENLYTGKDAEFRTMGRAWVESYLSKLCTIRGEHKLNDLRDEAKQLASHLGFEAQFKILNTIISALLQTGNARTLSAADALARAAGKPYDVNRIEIFDTLFAALNQPFEMIKDSPKSETNSDTNYIIDNGLTADPMIDNSRNKLHFAFFESYFSNFIEGTTFTVEEASEIIFDGKMIPMRNEDSHDVMGTFKAIMEEPFRSQPPGNETDFLSWLKRCNYQILSSRPDKNPGEWKELTNQAGNTIFVHPKLVRGTLCEGFKRIQALNDPFAKALMTMLVVTEVHPFMDGNGRTARLAMNAHLSQAALCRIIIPTAYREDYLLPLKAISLNNHPIPFIRSMVRAQKWTAGFNYSDFGKLWGQMSACNAFTDNPTQFRLLNPLDRD